MLVAQSRRAGTTISIPSALRTGSPILDNYEDAAEIQVWSWGGRDEPGYSRFRGLDEVGDTFDSLWADPNSQTVAGSTGLVVP